MVRHRNQASAPEICRPKISATAERLPSEPILPSPLKSKARRRPPRMVATMFPASTCAWRVACCAVGGDEPPSGVGIEAQSPSAQTPGNPGTSCSGVTWMRPPRALGSFTASITGWGNDGTVDTNVRVIDAVKLPKARGGRLPARPAPEGAAVARGWALGDCASIPTPDGGSSPPTAQHATRQAQVLAGNIVATIRGGRRRAFDFKGLGKMGSLGSRSAVAEIFGLQISGALAWFLWRTIYLLKLPGLGRKLKIAASWTFDLLLAPDSVLFRFSAPSSMLREHFEPGQEVFHQGDLGDRIYSIVAGAADVVNETADRETVLARLGPGELVREI